jgi:hypothetical protein
MQGSVDFGTPHEVIHLKVWKRCGADAVAGKGMMHWIGCRLLLLGLLSASPRNLIGIVERVLLAPIDFVYRCLLKTLGQMPDASGASAVVAIDEE